MLKHDKQHNNHTQARGASAAWTAPCHGGCPSAVSRQHPPLFSTQRTSCRGELSVPSVYLYLSTGESHFSLSFWQLNVGGRIFCCLKSTLSRVPGSFLARIAQGQVDVSRDNDGRIFIDRNPTYFAQILDALREPAAIAELPLDNAVMLRELEFYGLSKVRSYHSESPHSD